MKTVFITGGTGGLGTEVVRRLTREYRCVVFFHDDASFGALTDELHAGERLVGVRADLADEGSARGAMKQAAAEAKPFALVHLVGAFAAATLVDTTIATWQQMLTTNLTAAFLAVREFIAHAEEGARIVVISSESAISQSAGTIAYSVSKSALNVFVELAAKELSKRRITVNALAPASMDTPAMRAYADRATLVPLERVTESIAFLLSGAAAGISGAIIPIRA